MEIIESQMEFDLDKSYSHDLKSFIKETAITRIKGFIENFLEKDLKERKNAEFKDFKEEFEEYINCGEVYESDISGFSIEEQIEICQEADDFGILFLENSKITYKELRPMISRDCSFALNQLINRACFDFVCQLEKSMEEMGLTSHQLTDANNLGWMRHEKELEPNHHTQVYCYRCVEGEQEDYMLDESFRVESARDFLSDLSPDEKEFLYHRSNLKVCSNCGEYVSKINNGKCNICGKSKTHERIRCSSNSAEDDKDSFLEMVEKFNNRNDDFFY